MAKKQYKRYVVEYHIEGYDEHETLFESCVAEDVSQVPATFMNELDDYMPGIDPDTVTIVGIFGQL